MIGLIVVTAMHSCRSSRGSVGYCAAFGVRGPLFDPR